MKRKSIVSLLLAATTMTTVLAGCGTSEAGTTEQPADSTGTGETSTTPAEPVTITVYEHGTHMILGDEVLDANGNTVRDPETAYLRKIADNFTAETGINVEFVGYTGPDDVMPLLKTGDPSVDIFSNGGGSYTMEEINAYFEPVMTLDQADTIFGGRNVYQSIEQDDNGLYWWPMGQSYNNGIVYNEEALKSVGYDAVPETYEEFFVMCEKLRDAGITPIALHRVENWPLSAIASFADYQTGEAGSLTKMLDLEKPFDAETSPIGKTLKVYADLKANKMFEQEIYADFGVPMNEVAEGNAAMMLFGSWVVQQIQSRVPEGTDPSIIKFDASVDFGAGRFIAQELALAYAINKGSDNKEEAKLFLDYVSKQPEFAAKGGFISARADIEPIIPELFNLINEKVEAGTVTLIPAAPKDANAINADLVLSEADLKADEKWAGLPFDAVNVNKPDDFTAFYKQLEKQNEYYKNAQADLGFEYQK